MAKVGRLRVEHGCFGSCVFFAVVLCAKVGRPRVERSCFGLLESLALLQSFDVSGSDLLAFFAVVLRPRLNASGLKHGCFDSHVFSAVVVGHRFDASGLNTAALVRLHSLQLSCGKGWAPRC